MQQQREKLTIEEKIDAIAKSSGYVEVVVRYVRRYNNAIVKLEHNPNLAPQKLRHYYNAVGRALYGAAYATVKAIAVTGVTPEYIEGVLHKRIQLHYTVTPHLILIAQSKLSYRKFLALVRTTNTWWIEDIVRNLPTVAQAAQQHTEIINPIVQELYKLKRHADASGQYEQLKRTVREILVHCVTMLPGSDIRFLPVFRALMPCCWCGKEPPLTSEGWDLRKTSVFRLTISLPCCPSCGMKVEPPNVEPLVKGLLAYTVALESYAERVDYKVISEALSSLL